MSKEINIIIDERVITTTEGSNLVQIARDNDIFIPSICYFPDIEPALGTCRVCICEVDGVIQPACMTTARDGQVIHINQPALIEQRKAITEMMFAEGNHFCPSCEKSGNCALQHMAYEMGMVRTRYPHLFKDRIIDFDARRMILEHNRCIKCMRCVEEVRTDDGQQVFSFMHRGNDTVVAVDYDLEAQLSETQAQQAMDLCPTGAIIVRGAVPKPFGDRSFDLTSSQENKPVASPILHIPNRPPFAPKTIATVSLAGCFGCHMSMLDIDLELLELVTFLDFSKSPLTDIKNFTKKCDLGLIEGGCCNAENIETLRAFRQNCDVLVSVGECAIWGGIPAMRNTIPLEECLEESYLNSITSEQNASVIPYSEDLPKILDKVYACSDVVRIDHYIPGCPPEANHIWKVIRNLLWGEQYSILYHEFKYD